VSANLVNREQRQGHQGFLKRLMAILEDMIKELRERFMSISWYMKRLNETVTRLATKKTTALAIYH
jgi:hypothetical protein